MTRRIWLVATAVVLLGSMTRRFICLWERPLLFLHCSDMAIGLLFFVLPTVLLGFSFGAAFGHRCLSFLGINDPSCLLAIVVCLTVVFLCFPARCSSCGSVLSHLVFLLFSFVTSVLLWCRTATTSLSCRLLHRHTLLAVAAIIIGAFIFSVFLWHHTAKTTLSCLFIFVFGSSMTRGHTISVHQFCC